MFKFLGQFAPPPSSFSVSILIPLIILLPGILALLVLLVAYLKSEITLTNRRLIYRTGLLSRMSGELPLENVDTIVVFESLLGRAFGFGTVTVTSVGGMHFPLSYIGASQSFYAALQKAVKDAKSPPQKFPPSPPPDDSRYMPKR